MTGSISYAEKLAVIDEIRVSVKSFGDTFARGLISIVKGDSISNFELLYSYREKVELDENLSGLLMVFPAINFTLFTKKLVLDFPVSDNDLKFIHDFVSINNTEVFINKIVRRRYPFFKTEFLPDESDITKANSVGVTEIVRTSSISDDNARLTGGAGNVAVLSSGGKESLLSYGILKEIGASPHAFYFNESGSHWFTASTAYRDYASRYSNVHKVWSNVDRLYRFFLRNLPQIDQEFIRKKTDTYPVQLFIFPVYIMSLVPIAKSNGITSVVLGDEFDDPREMTDYMGIKHYYGIYDQTHDFNRTMSEYLTSKIGDFTVWSAVYPVSGSVVEKILVSRYPELFRLQRSCHSCRSKEGEMVPCGRCSKCLGIMMFTLAAGGNPADINYRNQYIGNLKTLVANERMRLDSDELNLMKIRLGFSDGDAHTFDHVSGVHILPDEKNPFEKMPETYRDSISAIIWQYVPLTYHLKNQQWVDFSKVQKNSASVLSISS